MDLAERFVRHWKAEGFNQLKAPHLLAVSGGVDSMVLADLLHRAGIPFAIAHCNFGLRGEESDGDAAFVSQFAEQHNIACYTTAFDTKTEAASMQKSIQETARDLRYAWFETLRKTHGYGCIITAHHADDNVETLLMHLLRGSGIRGIGGIPPKTETLLRPLLFATKADILGYASQQHIVYHKDSSNDTDHYLRNAIRHRVMTGLESVSPDAVLRMNENIFRFREGAAIYEDAVTKRISKLIEKRGSDFYIPVRKLAHIKPQRTFVYELCAPFGFSAAQVPDILQLMHAESGKFLSSPTHRIIRNREFLIITSAQTEETDFISVTKDTSEVNAGGHHLACAWQDVPANIPAEASIALLDANKLAYPLILRRWRIGDYFYPLGMGMKKKKLSRFFIDQKLSLHQKEQIWVLESDKRIAWVCGMRLDERFKVTGTTKQVLRVTLTTL